MRVAAVLLIAGVGSFAVAAELPVLPGSALWLEQVPGTTDILVVGSWTEFRDPYRGIQGWSYTICHDPRSARIGDCAGLRFHPCRCQPSPGCRSACPEIRCTQEALSTELISCGTELAIVDEGWVGHSVHPFGCLSVVHIPPAARFEMLRISYTGLADTARLEFCDTVEDESAPICFIVGGGSYRPERIEGLTVDFRRPFRRGDANASAALDLADVVFTLSYLFRAGSAPPCLAAADANDDDAVDIADPVALLEHLFEAAGPLPEPFTTCGFDATADGISMHCRSYAPCGGGRTMP
jgi:hypothetical protein